MAEQLTEPPQDVADPGELVIQYLDHYRDTVWHKVEGLTEADLRRAVLPSGWSMLELLHHLLYVERRWLQWCFLGVGEELPRGDWDLAAGRWAVPDDLAAETVRAEFWQEAERSRRLVAEHPLATVAQRTRDEGLPPPTLAWILFHLLQEYARHAGHLDATRELIDDSNAR
ncbi:DinB family protein [Microlunatus speluncae]|uniref:DinB family protein n=1 Tax=Microlunatus speluncae TaxID=2594267 RepID=UPI0012661796|nr:DinB family protein [Microlunatus speluncae]